MLELNRTFEYFATTTSGIRNNGIIHRKMYVGFGFFLSHQPNCIFPSFLFPLLPLFHPKEDFYVLARYFFSTYINVGRLMLSKRMKGKDKKSKVHPLFPSSHHDIYARAHTHDPRQYSWQKGIDQGPCHLTHHFTIRTWPGETLWSFCWISIRKSRLNIYCVKLGRRWRGSIFCLYPFFF